MCLLKGMKQTALGKAMGMAQQNVSKMENKDTATEEILERAAKALGTTVEAIKKFGKDKDFNFFFGSTPIQHNYPINEVIAYFKEELVKGYDERQELKDEIATLKAELEAFKNGSSEPSDNVKSLARKAK